MNNAVRDGCHRVGRRAALFALGALLSGCGRPYELTFYARSGTDYGLTIPGYADLGRCAASGRSLVRALRQDRGGEELGTAWFTCSSGCHIDENFPENVPVCAVVERYRDIT